MKSKMNLEKAIEIMVNARKEYDANRPKIEVLDTVPKPENKPVEVKEPSAMTMDGKKCKLKVNPTYKCYCTRHGNKI